MNKPCPWCGGAPEVVEFTAMGDYRARLYAVCRAEDCPVAKRAVPIPLDIWNAPRPGEEKIEDLESRLTEVFMEITNRTVSKPYTDVAQVLALYHDDIDEIDGKARREGWEAGRDAAISQIPRVYLRYVDSDGKAEFGSYDDLKNKIRALQYPGEE